MPAKPLTKKQRHRMNIQPEKYEYLDKKMKEERIRQDQFKRTKQLSKIYPMHKHHHFKQKLRKLL